MKRSGDRVRLSASDLAEFVECRHKTELDREVVRGARAAPPLYRDPVAELLAERGLAHERAYVDHLGAEAVRIQTDGDAVAATAASLRRGVALVVQGTLAHGRWWGRADILRRVEGESGLGSWHYEVIDTKLAVETRARTVIQLCLYSELLAAMQSRPPEHFHVVAPGADGAPFAVQSYRLAEFAPYYRLVRGRLEAAVPEMLAESTQPARTYPDPVDHCDYCRWWQVCDARRRGDDSVWLVAGVTRGHRRELDGHGIDTLEQLAHQGSFAPERVSREQLIKVRDQARVQLAGRSESRPVHELLALEPARGLARLPAPSPRDLFFDIEGDRMGIAEGREFLFGLAWAGPGGALEYQCRWALDDGAERAGLEWVVDTILARRERDPGMHVYHYAPYEPAALKRLMGKYAAREAAVDLILRAGLFVDLYAVTRQSLRASVERYSIKNLEGFYGFERSGDLRRAGACVRAVQLALGRGAPHAIDDATRVAVESYNRDDCFSTARLRDWLETLRAELEQRGPLPRPEPPGDGAPPEAVDERQRAARAVADRLLAGVPAEPAARTAEQEACWLLAQLLEYHRREEKVTWWEFYRLCELSPDDALEERMALGQLTLEGTVATSARGLPIQRYRFPVQDVDIDPGDKVTAQDRDTLGTVVAIDRVAGWVEIQKTEEKADQHPDIVFKHDDFPARAQEAALLRLGQSVAERGQGDGGPHAAAVALLRKSPPRLSGGATLAPQGDESAAEVARRIATRLDRTVLAIQGPPGSGKTYTAARMIVELVRAGKRVGVVAVAHKVIRKVLLDVVRTARDTGAQVSCLHKLSEASADPGPILETDSNPRVRKLLAAGSVQVVGGTSWLWARPDMAGSVDVLVVDEAGQLALANALAVAQAASSLVLLGDPRQLEQPQKGAHPDGADVSALEYLLDGHQTMPEGRGLFLSRTRRLAPAICAFTSELFYEGRLEPSPGLERQTIVGPTRFAGAGLFHVPVAHRGNSSSAPEEVAAVAAIVEELLAPGIGWINLRGETAPLGPADILVVAPYNAQVDRLHGRLAERGIAVGTVDRFQGQEAPVVIFSTATSTPEDAPRGMEFLYSLNRLNVATSRAKCVCILVASPRLFDPECRTPRQMQLASAFCRYLELATTLG